MGVIRIEVSLGGMALSNVALTSHSVMGGSRTANWWMPTSACCICAGNVWESHLCIRVDSQLEGCIE